MDKKVQKLVNKAASIPLLKVSACEWWSEALHEVSRHGKDVRFNGTIKSTTMFPQIILATPPSILIYGIMLLRECTPSLSSQRLLQDIMDPQISFPFVIRARCKNTRFLAGDDDKYHHAAAQEDELPAELP
ncbi:uncharacterized protein LOC127255155 [Andrographis paniculata]|uniref:uncharacterized protein LOC127255155 n=1 Tax=Andrographis paniculata TaxID=175694 RepID=UPI0021E8DB8A|nr:uncharacterized protein LOC127255155 [Andrographis paniculata]